MPSSERSSDIYTRYNHLLQCGEQRSCMHCPYNGRLHDLEVKAADMLSAYVLATKTEKIWIMISPEFRDHDGK